MAEVKVFIIKVLRRLPARGYLAVSHQEAHWRDSRAVEEGSRAYDQDLYQAG